MSATIKHGRRRGQSRGNTPEMPPLQMTGQGIGQNGPNAADLRQVTVLSKGDWDRIQYQLNKRIIEQERIKKIREEKERMHQLSKEKVKDWSNTIAGQRQKKLEARKIREEKEEEERKLIDIEEAKFQSAKRKEAIEKAKTQQYYQTDRVKGFHSALLLTEVLKEREAQLELKRLKSAAGQGQDKEYLEAAQRDYEEAILKDQEEARLRIEMTRETANFQKSQMYEHVKAANKASNEDRTEGEELKRLAAQYELEKKRLDEIREAEARQLMADNLKQIEDVDKMKKVHQMQEEEEDEECRVFAAAKRKMMKLRAEKEKQLHKEKQEKLERIREKLNAQMQQKQDDEDSRIRRALEESEAKRAKEEAAKEAKMKKAFADIAEHRTSQMQEKERQAAEERKKELETLLVKKEADALFAKNEEEKRRRRVDETKGLQGFHLQQINERGHHGKMVREEQLALDRKNQELVELEEQQFQEYAKKVIDHADRGGRNTLPLKKAAREGAGGGLGPVFPGKGGVRPSYMVADQSGVQMPNYQRDTTEDTKKLIYGNGETNKRLGFVW